MKESVGNVYCGIQPYEKAIDYYEEALHVVQEGEDKDGERKLQKRLGDACCNIHQYGKTADELYTMSSAKLRNGSLPQGSVLAPILFNVYTSNPLLHLPSFSMLTTQH